MKDVMMDSAQKNSIAASQSTAASIYMADSAFLSGIKLNGSGSASLIRTENGTTLNVDQSDPYSSMINGLYEKNLGRSADAAGLTWWKNQIMNNGVTITAADKAIANSDEKKAKAPNVQPVT